MDFQVPDRLFERVLSLLAFAVYEHVQQNGTSGQRPFKADGGWEDSYELLEAFEKIEREQVVR